MHRRLVTVRVVENAAGASEAFPRFAVTFRAKLGRGYDIFRLETAGPALHLKDRDALRKVFIRVVRCELTLGRKSFHAD